MSALIVLGFVQIARTEETVWIIISIPATIFGLSTVFCMCCAFVSVVTLLCFAVIFFHFSMGFSLIRREFSLFSRRFLYSALAFFILPWVFFLLPWVFFILPWVFFNSPWVFFILPWFLYCAVSFLYFTVAFFTLPWVFFILPWFSSFFREYYLFCRDFNYIAMVLFFLPWQLWATVQLQFRNENQNFISNFIFQFIKKTKWHLGYTDSCYTSSTREVRCLILKHLKTWNFCTVLLLKIYDQKRQLDILIKDEMIWRNIAILDERL